MSDALERAWEALEAGDPEACLRGLERVDASDPDRYLAASQAWLELGELRAARQALEQAEALALPEDDPQRLWARAEVELASWELESARADFERLRQQEPSAAVLARLALCAELRGELEQADRLLAKAHALDPEQVPRPVRLSPRAFDRVVERALTELAPAHRAALENVPIVIEPMPTRALVPPGAEAEVPPELLGLFVGSALGEDGSDPGGSLPPSIHLFQRNLERYARDEDELVDEIRVTLFHEIGHRLGFDEHGVDELGLA